MEQPRTQHAVAVLGQNIYVIGGYEGGLNKVVRFDTALMRWFDCAPMGTMRANFGVAAHGENIYAVGGTKNLVDCNVAERYDPAENKWTQVCVLMRTTSSSFVFQF